MRCQVAISQKENKRAGGDGQRGGSRYGGRGDDQPGGSKGGGRGDDTGIPLTPTPAPDPLPGPSPALSPAPCHAPSPSPGRGDGPRRHLVQTEPERMERRWIFGQHYFADDEDAAVDRLFRNNDLFTDAIDSL